MHAEILPCVLPRGNAEKWDGPSGPKARVSRIAGNWPADGIVHFRTYSHSIPCYSLSSSFSSSSSSITIPPHPSNPSIKSTHQIHPSNPPTLLQQCSSATWTHPSSPSPPHGQSATRTPTSQQTVQNGAASPEAASTSLSSFFGCFSSF